MDLFHIVVLPGHADWLWGFFLNSWTHGRLHRIIGLVWFLCMNCNMLKLQRCHRLFDCIIILHLHLNHPSPLRLEMFLIIDNWRLHKHGRLVLYLKLNVFISIWILKGCWFGGNGLLVLSIDDGWVINICLVDARVKLDWFGLILVKCFVYHCIWILLISHLIAWKLTHHWFGFNFNINGNTCVLFPRCNPYRLHLIYSLPNWCFPGWLLIKCSTLLLDRIIVLIDFIPVCVVYPHLLVTNLAFIDVLNHSILRFIRWGIKGGILLAVVDLGWWLLVSCCFMILFRPYIVFDLRHNCVVSLCSIVFLCL